MIILSYLLESFIKWCIHYISVQGRSQGGALGARAPPLEKKCLEGSKGLKTYPPDQRFSPLTGTPLRKFLATPLYQSKEVECNGILLMTNMIFTNRYINCTVSMISNINFYWHWIYHKWNRLLSEYKRRICIAVINYF